MSILLIVTSDYEILGDGKGDPERLMAVPTAEILRLCDEYVVPHTLFVEVLEILAFKKAEAEGTFPGYRAASVLENQLRDAVAKGHDAQLHLHPQWLGATAKSPQDWDVSMRYWRLADAPGGVGHPERHDSVRGLLRRGKSYLEGLLCPARNSYRCLAFRAGGYCIQPESGILDALQAEGFRVDSSAVPGCVVDRGYACYDYRGAPRNMAYWTVSSSVSKPDPRGTLLELPVHVFPRVNALVATQRKPSPASGILRSPQVVSARQTTGFCLRVLRKLGIGHYHLDFCRLKARSMINAVRRARRLHGASDTHFPAPLVMTGHCKEWSGPGEFRTFLDWASGQSWLGFTTFPGWLKAVDVPGVRN